MGIMGCEKAASASDGDTSARCVAGYSLAFLALVVVGAAVSGSWIQAARFFAVALIILSSFAALKGIRLSSPKLLTIVSIGFVSAGTLIGFGSTGLFSSDAMAAVPLSIWVDWILMFFGFCVYIASLFDAFRICRTPA